MLWPLECSYFSYSLQDGRVDPTARKRYVRRHSWRIVCPEFSVSTVSQKAALEPLFVTVLGRFPVGVFIINGFPQYFS